MLLEVCVDSVESAVNAEKGGAARIELCGSLAEGGTTPTVGVLMIVKQLVKIPVYVIIRPRGGDFLYNDQELAAMREDIKALKNVGCDGIVLGVLTSEGSVDVDRTQDLIDVARPLPVTFHRAFDMTNDLNAALESVICLGCERVLTSGGETSALEGAPVIRRLLEQAGHRIIVMPGGGITERNVVRILDETGAREIHASVRRSRQSNMLHRNCVVNISAGCGHGDYIVKVTDRDCVRNLIEIAKGAV